MEISKFEKMLGYVCRDILDEEENKLIIDTKNITKHNFSIEFEEDIKGIINFINSNKLKDCSKFDKYIFFLLN